MLQGVNWVFRNLFFLAVGSCFADVAAVGENSSNILANNIRAEDPFPDKTLLELMRSII